MKMHLFLLLINFLTLLYIGGDASTPAKQAGTGFTYPG